jgi:hypothetical protein
MMRSIFLASALFLGAATIAYAEMPDSDWISKDALTKQMESQGYSAIVLKADDGRWEGQAIKDGKIIEFHADPHTGMITKSELRAATTDSQ